MSAQQNPPQTAGKSAAGYNIDPNRYQLNLNDIIIFPDAAHAPVLAPLPGESWYVLTEIKSTINTHILPAYKVEDRLPGKYWPVVFYTENGWADARDCKPGRVLCLKNARPIHMIEGGGDWGMGYRIFSKDEFLVLPCSLDELRQINQGLLDRYASGHFLLCVVCNKPAETRCENCKTRYCSVSCQQAESSSHQQVCQVIKTLLEWNATDWG